MAMALKWRLFVFSKWLLLGYFMLGYIGLDDCPVGLGNCPAGARIRRKASVKI